MNTPRRSGTTLVNTDLRGNFLASNTDPSFDQGGGGVVVVDGVLEAIATAQSAK